jgi:hypothetical protein
MVNSHWSEWGLEVRVMRSLNFADMGVNLVETEDASFDLANLEAPSAKIVAESSMLLRAVIRIADRCDPAIGDRARDLVLRLLPYARSQKVLFGLALHPALALDYAASSIVLSSIGYRDTTIEELLKVSLDASTAAGRERLPHRALEQAWLRWILGLGPFPLDQIANTALVNGFDLLSGNRDDVYAFTHALMYATDFGAVGLPGEYVGDLVFQRARSALAGALDDDDFDLAGELLFTWPFLRYKWDAIASFAFQVLATVEDEVGALPSQALNRKAYEQYDEEVREKYVAAATYHTAYVMGLLCASIMATDERPVAVHGIETKLTLKEANDALLEELYQQNARPQWLQIARTLTSDVATSIAPLILDVAIRRSVRDLNLKRIRELLIFGVQNEIEPTLLRYQAAELLGRTAKLSA